jgi:hypothetical protein
MGTAIIGIPARVPTQYRRGVGKGSGPRPTDYAHHGNLSNHSGKIVEKIGVGSHGAVKAGLV